MSQRDATDVFSEWADKGKDAGMEKGHARSVHAMLELAGIPRNSHYSAIDVGCGNGWVCRTIAEDKMCSHVVGVDGSSRMVEKAHALDEQGEYHLALLPDWEPSGRFDLIHSMEFLYYLHDPQTMLKLFNEKWLNNGGMLVAGVDHYLENENSLSWPEALNVHMTTLSIDQWKTAMVDAGFIDVEVHQVGKKEGFIGTLVLLGKKG
ncbi:MAG: methyltransferase domain-containing protein [Euryarchaeota archaeon]|nr:methyltransferase domain-containing protein [Euryarchaeota archaeon]